jgi:hypothetical protein
MLKNDVKYHVMNDVISLRTESCPSGHLLYESGLVRPKKKRSEERFFVCRKRLLNLRFFPQIFLESLQFLLL